MTKPTSYPNAILTRTRRIRKALEMHEVDGHKLGKFLPSIGDYAVLEAEHLAACGTYEQLQSALEDGLLGRLSTLAEQMESDNTSRAVVENVSRQVYDLCVEVKQIPA
jgi:hypothetical protein